MDEQMAALSETFELLKQLELSPTPTNVEIMYHVYGRLRSVYGSLKEARHDGSDPDGRNETEG